MSTSLTHILLSYSCALIVILSISSCRSIEEKREEKQVTSDIWISLFNGENLDEWIPKVKGYPIGENPGHTFRVADSCLTISYDDEDMYPTFDNQFGHIFYHHPYSHYHLRFDYRFIGEQCSGGEPWAFKNSGIMIHSQDPYTMTTHQDFPISIEAQLLGASDTIATRTSTPTMNVCTPGTEIKIDGHPVEDHCIYSSSRPFHTEDWVHAEIIAYGDSLIIHIVEGDTVLTYGSCTIGGGIVNNYDSAVKTDGKILERGYIAIQSESHPLQVKNLLLKDLSEK